MLEREVPKKCCEKNITVSGNFSPLKPDKPADAWIGIFPL